MEGSPGHGDVPGLLPVCSDGAVRDAVASGGSCRGVLLDEASKVQAQIAISACQLLPSIAGADRQLALAQEQLDLDDCDSSSLVLDVFLSALRL